MALTKNQRKEAIKKLKELGLDDAIIPQLRSALQKNPKLLKAVENPKLANDLTLLEAQDLKNAITSSSQTVIRRAIKGNTSLESSMHSSSFYRMFFHGSKGKSRKIRLCEI